MHNLLGPIWTDQKQLAKTICMNCVLVNMQV